MKEKKKKRRQEELPDYTVAHMDVDGHAVEFKASVAASAGRPCKGEPEKEESSICGTNRSR